MARFAVLRCYQLFSDKSVWQLIELIASGILEYGHLKGEDIVKISEEIQEWKTAKNPFRDFHLGILFPFDSYYIDLFKAQNRHVYSTR